MRVGVFTPLLSQLPLEDVLKKLSAKGITTVELGTGNYPGNAHCKLSMLDDGSELEAFRKKLADKAIRKEDDPDVSETLTKLEDMADTILSQKIPNCPV